MSAQPTLEDIRRVVREELDRDDADEDVYELLDQMSDLVDKLTAALAAMTDELAALKGQQGA